MKKIINFALIIIFLPLLGCQNNQSSKGDSDTSTDSSIETDSIDSDTATDTQDSEPPRGYVSHEKDLEYGNAWSRAWGGTGSCYPYGTAIGIDGEVYVTGGFSETVDFNPGDGEDLHTASNSQDLFLSRYEADGTYGWTITWGGKDRNSLSGWGDKGWVVAVDTDGSIYLGGQYAGYAAFEELAGVESHWTNGFDAFLMKLTSDGDIVWSRRLDSFKARVTSISIHNSIVFISGIAQAGATFGLGDEAEQNFEWAPLLTNPVDSDTIDTVDCYAAAYSADGDPLWASVWGSSWNEYNCKSDLFGSGLIVVGDVDMITDLNPGPETLEPPERLSLRDPFQMIFDESGNWLNTTLWQGEWNESTPGVTSRGEYAFVSGQFDGPVDFQSTEQPGFIGLENENSGDDSYIMRIESDYSHSWVRTWGGTGRTLSNNITSTASEVISTGSVTGTFTWDDNIEISTGENKYAFIRAFSHEGAPSWSYLLSGDDIQGHNITATDNELVVVGSFSDTANLSIDSEDDFLWESPGLHSCFLLKFPLN